MTPQPFGRPPSPGIPGQRTPPSAPAPTVEPVPSEPDGDEIQPNRAAVAFRTEAETCGKCTYMQGDMCSHPMVAQQVAVGDSCSAFEVGGEAEVPTESVMGGMEIEEPAE